MKRTLVLLLAATLACALPFTIGAQIIVQSTPSGGAIGGACSTSNALAQFTAAQTLGCSAVIDASGALSGITTLSMSGQLTSTLAAGTAPFVVASNTVVSNLNASLLGGATFAAPGAIGGGTPSTGAFTTITATSLQGIIGNATPAAGTFTATAITPAANATPFTVSGYSLTGSNASSLTAFSGALSTSGVVHVNDWSITNTASGTGSTAFRIRGGASGTTPLLSIRLSDGATAIGTTISGNFTLELPVNGTLGVANGGNLQFYATSNAGGLTIYSAPAYSPTGATSSSLQGWAHAFSPSGAASASYALLHLNPTITGASTGTAYGLLLASKTNTLTGGTIRLASFGTTTTDGFTGYAPKVEIATNSTILQTGVTFANLGTPAVGAIVYCSDCDAPAAGAMATCTSAGTKTGAWAFRVNTTPVWGCIGI